MRLTRLTPEQARALGEHVARTARLLRQVVDAFREMARALTAAVRPLVDYLRRCGLADDRPARERRRRPHAVRLAGDRPAWASPYGPAPRRHR